MVLVHLLRQRLFQIFYDFCDSLLFFLRDGVPAIRIVDLVHEFLRDLLHPAESSGFGDAPSNLFHAAGLLLATIGKRVVGTPVSLSRLPLALHLLRPLDRDFPFAAILSSACSIFSPLLALTRHSTAYVARLLLFVFYPEVCELNGPLHVSETVLRGAL